MKEHPGVAASQRREALTRTCQMFWENVDQLDRWLRVFESTDVAPLLMHRGGYAEPGDALQEYEDELFRLWFNYAASATAPVEHAEEIAKQEAPDFQSKFKERAKGVRGTAAEAITRGLRNILLHLGWPSFMFQFDLGPSQQHGMYCDAKLLLATYDRWGRSARDRLQTLVEQGKPFSLRGSIEDFADAIDRFYDWFWDAHTEEHMEDLTYLYRLHEEYERVIPPDRPLKEQLAERRRDSEA